MDIAATVRASARRDPSAASLRGLGDAWRLAESALLADIAAAPRRGRHIVARFARLARLSGEPEAMGRAARLHGSALFHAGRFRESVAPYRDAVRRLSGAARDGARIGLALSMAELGRYAPAIALCRAVRRDAERRGDSVIAAAAQLNEAGAIHQSGHAAKALPLYRAARESFVASGQPRHAARAAEAEANALVLLERFDEALPLFASAAAGLESAGLARESAVARYNRGCLLVAIDRIGEADAELDTAERELRAAGDTPNAALARLDRGEALLNAHLVPEAGHLLRTALRAMGRRVPPSQRARGTLLLARAAIAAGDAVAARRILARPLRGAGPDAAAQRTELLGRALAAEGRPREARRLLSRAAAAHGTARPASRARTLAAAAWCAAASGDVRAATRDAAAAESLASGLSIPGTQFAAHAARFAAEDLAGNRAGAARALTASFVALEALRAGLGPDTFRAALLSGSESWFARAVRHVLETNGGPAALDLIERWRARALIDQIADGDAVVSPADISHGDRLAGLRARLAVLERRLAGGALPPFLRSTTAAPERRAVREIAAAERSLREVTDRRPPGGIARSVREDHPSRSASAAAAALPAGTLVVSLFADAEGGLAFAASRGGVSVATGLGSAPEIARLVEELGYRIGKFALGGAYADRHRRRLAAETEAVLATLAHQTLGPIADLIRGAERLVFIPHGPWHRVPFAALPFDGGRLCDRLPVTCAPAMSAPTATADPARGASLVVAVADVHSPAIADEGRRVAAAIPGARLVEGDEAVGSLLVGLDRPAVLHIAAHGRYRDDAPALSGVRLADGWFRACEFAGLRLGGSLVVLAGCDTGVARGESGGEVLGLVRGVLAAGARELVVSLWRIDDGATAAFMAEFHAARARGLSSAVALQELQKSRAASGLHPWFWAGFSIWTRCTDGRL
ncbi:MAG: CHAT domain-containing protein [Planctomycetes bacterium]|nr:CHAT domain-containing protein [Planctomycetota bacterium]